MYGFTHLKQKRAKLEKGTRGSSLRHQMSSCEAAQCNAESLLFQAFQFSKIFSATMEISLPTLFFYLIFTYERSNSKRGIGGAGTAHFKSNQLGSNTQDDWWKGNPAWLQKFPSFWNKQPLAKPLPCPRCHDANTNANYTLAVFFNLPPKMMGLSTGKTAHFSPWKCCFRALKCFQEKISALC